MSMQFKRLLPIPRDIREEMPLSEDMKKRKVDFDKQVMDVLSGKLSLIHI